MLADAVALSIVAIAAVYTSWKLMPVAARRRIATTLTRIAQRNARLTTQQAVTIERRLMGKACGACHSCGGCGSKPAGRPE